MKKWWFGILAWALPYMVHAQAVDFPNYLRDVEDLPTLAGRIIKGWFLGAAGIFAMIFFVWGGFDWIMAEGNDEKIAIGTKKMIWATMGILAIMLSYAFVNGFLSFVFGL